MIVRPRPGMFGLLRILRGSIITTIAPRLLVVAVVATAVAVCNDRWPARIPDLTLAPFTLLGLMLSIVLGFRNNACYDRWWEGRRQWGQLVAEIRGFSRDVSAILPDNPRLRRRIVHRAVAFAHALRNQLRAVPDRPDLPLRWWLPDAEWSAVARARSRPDVILLATAADLRDLCLRRSLSDIFYQVLSERLMAMTAIQTACERLRATPAPFTYSLLLHRTAWLFCLLLPFGLVHTLGFTTPLVVVLLAYAFFGLDALGDELEDLFSYRPNALPLDALVRSIEIAAGEALGDTDLPAPLRPVGYILR